MMRLVDEIVEKAMQDHGNTTGHNAGFMVIGESDLESLIAARLEPVREAFEYAWSWVESPSVEDERKCKEVSALLSEEE